MSAYYASSVGEFLNTSQKEVRDFLVTGSQQFPNLSSTQAESWQDQIAILQAALSALKQRLPSAVNWGVLLEFSIPRRQRRIDAVILARDVIFVLEFKSGRSDRTRSAARQVEDYALDLADFHLPSHKRTIIPIVVADGASDGEMVRTSEWVQSVKHADADRLVMVLVSAFELCSSPEARPIDWSAWQRGVYCPVPTIIEAATALYAGASVREITQSHSGIENLTKTTDFILRAIEAAQRSDTKLICFLTGIPGAGKTLAGLNLAHSPEIRHENRPASVFMSGNRPLIKILRAALAKDAMERTGETKQKIGRHVRTFIQNVHQFVSLYLERENGEASYERAIIFDEAQRAWTTEHNIKKHPKKGPQWHVSEPEMILKIMSRHSGWAVIVALVGGGQEIHEGEAGLAAWGAALEKFPDWHVLASPEALDGGPSVAGNVLFPERVSPNIVSREPLLHLDTFVRSPKAEKLAEWVNHILKGESDRAAQITLGFDQFPVVITREVSVAREWLQRNTRGERRCGLVASSGAARLRAYGIEVSTGFRHGYPYEQWFLASSEDVRSSFQLEVVASEFEIQGLELDNVGVCWGGDFVWSHHSQSWLARTFRGPKWQAVQAPERYEQARNKYRVLLTRARRGLLIWVPRGDKSDPTQNVQAMDETADYLRDCGCRSLD
jgi:hypothetical protein